jgi:hypothetical protein
VFLLSKKIRKANTSIHSNNRIIRKLFYALQDESLTIGYRTAAHHVIKDGVVIEHKEDLLMMECS